MDLSFPEETPKKEMSNMAKLIWFGFFAAFVFYCLAFTSTSKLPILVSLLFLIVSYIAAIIHVKRISKIILLAIPAIFFLFVWLGEDEFLKFIGYVFIGSGGAALMNWANNVTDKLKSIELSLNTLHKKLNYMDRNVLKIYEEDEIEY